MLYSKSKLFLFSIAVAMLCICPPTVSAKDQAKQFDNKTFQKWAMQFEINQNFDLNSFEGSTLSLKRMSSPAKAWRLGLDLDAGTANGDDITVFDDSLTNTSDVDNDHYSIAISIHRVTNTNPDSKISFFYGYGPFGGYSYTKTGNRIIATTGNSTGQITKSRTWSAGLRGIMGVEWFFAKNMSLLAEYGSSVSYRRNKRTQATDYSDGSSRLNERIDKVWNFDAELVKFGLSAYF